MFEKSLYDLIRGLRNHKGNEKEYISNCLKECRKEIRSQDMDIKATALLKLVYLEMFGHDMSWASFHVLEVMSSPKYHQKRLGYLGAVQSFRPDTEVLMLATNLLKKDVTSAATTSISLPITALPHIINPSLALSVLSDLLPRLSHTNPGIRKKTIVTLYRLALVYPETLRAAWPKIKERLMDKDEDPNVTAAIVNVICELGWRRPQDFLPLAPRLFELLVNGRNNWMAIKLIKLFATLTPLEPRLVKKLLPPLTEIIKTTPAMSLLYECINGIIQGGILGSADDDVSGREEIATLCVNKLRGMVVIDGDANLKYVALLAFNKIVVTHPFLVGQQEDVIMECIDSSDITIRIKALDLVQGMVSSDNLVSIVSRLMRQLKHSAASARAISNDPRHVNMQVDSDDDERARITTSRSGDDQVTPLPEDYRLDVIGRILAMCSQNNYGALVDFNWYIDILTQLIRVAPFPRRLEGETDISTLSTESTLPDISERIGSELRNVAVKVEAIRRPAVRASEAILMQLNGEVPSNQSVFAGALKPVSFIVGEYASDLPSPDDAMSCLIHITPRVRHPEALASCLQAIMKIFALVAGDDRALWLPERKSKISLLMARILHVLEPLAIHPSLEVQERAVEFIELLKLTAEAASGQPTCTDEMAQDTPLLLTQAIPSMFEGWELNSVAPAAQRNVPMPYGLDLDEPIHPNLSKLLSDTGFLEVPAGEEDEYEVYYHKRPTVTPRISEPAVSRLADAPEEVVSSYQQATEDTYLDADILARRKAERLERNKDDPFYIQPASADPTRSSTPIHNILHSSNGQELDIDSIPIMQLDLEKVDTAVQGTPSKHIPRPKPRQRVAVAADETLGTSGVSTPGQYESENNSDSFTKTKSKKLKQSLLQVDSSNIGAFNLDNNLAHGAYDPEQQKREDAEMARALKEVERLRLEMQRANERIHVAQGVPVEGTVVKKKSAKKAKVAEGDDGAQVKRKKKKKKAPVVFEDGGPDDRDDDPISADGPTVVIKPKKKKKKAKATVTDMQEGPQAQ